NPDVLCNREIKFGVFLDHARRLGADLIATGHYARRETFAGRPALCRGRDPNKDQSYFLHAVTADALAKTVFPLGELAKDEVRRIARRSGLPVFAKKDSTGICFIGERPFREFLARYLPAQPGPILRPDGAEIGRHHGLVYYTLGQRQGLRIGGREDAGDAPWYVVDKRLADNALIVDQGDSPLLLSTALVAAEPTWIGGPPAGLAAGTRLTAQVRYRQPGQACRVRSAGDGSLVVEFTEPQRAVAPGQYVVFYAGDRCLGGARIEATQCTAAAKGPADAPGASEPHSSARAHRL
ncbi:MAG: tRNA 2-thiouridine(34) synthase MnmA, partial [Woeseiaceae bacterium]|nr:tRNA 2-thiouridine(34) synthase MnmA [Woeseiaceae bacterium]